jgi:succinate dehydrogenase / fumarate reductase, cytochrome b subunit
MRWFVDTIGTSVGKKLLMALTGLAFVGFLATHLAGNMTIYGGMDAFNSYSQHLHSLGPLVPIAETGLLIFALIHILTGATLFWQNFKARPQRYTGKKWGGGRTIGSATMPYTGFIILMFVILHLVNFHFVDKTHASIFEIVHTAFSNPVYVAIYTIAMLVVALHVSHGFWSLFQTLGANHPKYMPLIRGMGWVVSIIFAVGFGFLPIYVSLMA